MRQILITVMLILTVVAIYTAVVGGDGGMRAQIRSSGSGMAGAISRVSP
ncbi:hypothetical protein [Cohnella nanjingensis]|uniref:Uncharacterized protein n=1 Tax=Cohnella nanjingensis TaxID=1387779 RepID=A0A7X0RS39_9BACL|nr:hypothetical protein [Cohnella nanjingensis]MBB6672647.1 hypothetical protein [Cohnella nanjingensis]